MSLENTALGTSGWTLTWLAATATVVALTVAVHKEPNFFHFVKIKNLTYFISAINALMPVEATMTTPNYKL